MQRTSRRQRPPAERPTPLFDPPAQRAATRRAAGRSVGHAVEFIADRIVTHVADCGALGATAEETAVALGLRTQTASARFSELAKGPRIVASGRTRATSSGRAAVVYVAPPGASSPGGRAA